LIASDLAKAFPSCARVLGGRLRFESGSEAGE